MLNMNKIKFFLVCISFCFLLSSCGTIKEGFSMQKKKNTDEFLVEKKNPLKLPPNFDELPVPDTFNNKEKNKENEGIKDLISNTSNNSQDASNNSGSKNKNFEEFLLDKIKKN